MRVYPSFSIFAFLAVATGTGQAMGETGQPANRPAMEKAAKKACITGDVGRGIDLLGDLYVETGDATYVFNQGRCFEQNHQWEEAVDRFREYLRKVPDLTAKDKAQVNEHISDCETQRAKLAPPPAAPVAAAVPAAQPTPTTTPAPADEAMNLAAAPIPATKQRSGSRLRTAGIVAASVGALALAGGLVFNLEANSLASDLNKPAGWDRGKASSRETYQTFGWVGYGVGAAALITGATLFVLGGRSGTTTDEPNAVGLTPVVLQGLATLSLRGTY